MTTPYIATHAVEQAHKSDIFAVATCPRFTLAASGDGNISLWDNRVSGEQETTILNQQPIKAGVHHMAVDEAGTFCVAVAFDGSIAAFNLKTQTPLNLESTRDIKGAWSCAVSSSQAPGGTTSGDTTTGDTTSGTTSGTAAIATLKGSVFLVNLATDELITELVEPMSSTNVKRQPCLSVDISSDAKYVASGYEGGKVRIFNVETSRIAYTLPSHILRPISVKFNRQVTVLAVTGNESIALYTLTGGSYLGSLLGHDSLVYSASFDPAGERLLSVAGDGRVKVWSLDTREAVFTATVSNSPLFTGSWVPERSNIIAGAPAGFVTAGVDRTLRWYREASGSANEF